MKTYKCDKCHYNLVKYGNKFVCNSCGVEYKILPVTKEKILSWLLPPAILYFVSGAVGTIENFGEAAGIVCVIIAYILRFVAGKKMKVVDSVYFVLSIVPIVGMAMLYVEIILCLKGDMKGAGGEYILSNKDMA